MRVKNLKTRFNDKIFARSLLHHPCLMLDSWRAGFACSCTAHPSTLHSAGTAFKWPEGTTVIPAHALVLCAGSDWFECRLTRNDSLEEAFSLGGKRVVVVGHIESPEEAAAVEPLLYTLSVPQHPGCSYQREPRNAADGASILLGGLVAGHTEPGLLDMVSARTQHV